MLRAAEKVKKDFPDKINLKVVTVYHLMNTYEP